MEKEKLKKRKSSTIPKSKLLPDEKKELRRLQKLETQFKTTEDILKQKGSYEIYPIITTKSNEERVTIPIILASDWHIDEVVEKNSVLGKNEFNIDIAKKRIDNFFANIVKLINHHQSHYDINEIVFSFLGDGIGGWIHDELSQTNSMTPDRGIYMLKTFILSGLKYLHDNLNVDKIYVVMVAGNHTRSTKKIQHSNFNEVNKEYFAYLELRDICKSLNLNKLDFIISEAPICVVKLLGYNLGFTHGYQFRYQGGIGGIFPPLLRWYYKIAKVLNVDKFFLGHWHQFVSIKEVTINASLKGYDSYALSNGFAYEDPSQTLVLLDSKYGFCLNQQIFV